MFNREPTPENQHGGQNIKVAATWLHNIKSPRQWYVNCCKVRVVDIRWMNYTESSAVRRT